MCLSAGATAPMLLHASSRLRHGLLRRGEPSMHEHDVDAMLSMTTEQLNLRRLIYATALLEPLSRMGYRSILWYESDTL
jgi:hypothetical protein